MPIDKTYSDAMLGTFRNMMQECMDKKMSGKAFDTMSNAMDRMEAFALEMIKCNCYHRICKVTCNFL